jgi:16S rRNA (cytosine1402-N4)-methyltransferase
MLHLARTIVESREQQPITTTDELKEVLAKFLPEIRIKF